jgi:hypothetical protein
MGRTLLAIIFLAAVAVAVWFGARWLAGRDTLEATIMFDSADELAAGAPVVSKSLVIGQVTRVTPVQGRDAVSVRIEAGHRDEFLVDSRFSIEGAGETAILRVSSLLAFGRPAEEGDVLYARPSRIARWFGEAGGPVVERVRAQAARWRGREDAVRRFEEWRRELPSWERAGEEVVAKNLEEIGRRVDELEAKLRKSGNEIDARRLRRDFETWLDEVRASWGGEEAEMEPPTQSVR